VLTTDGTGVTLDDVTTVGPVKGTKPAHGHDDAGAVRVILDRNLARSESPLTALSVANRVAVSTPLRTEPPSAERSPVPLPPLSDGGGATRARTR
jgi:hypothetical protein